MRILIVEDDEFDYRLVKRNLERAFQDTKLEFVWVQVPDVADLCLSADTFDVCFVDNRLGDVLGIDLIRTLCKAGIITPLILLTGDETSELDQTAIEAGAADFLHKDKLSVSSIHRLTRYCLARKEQEQRLIEMAFTDRLTSLSNRAAFDQRCKIILSRDRADRNPLAVVLIDLDDFKDVNDTYGHPAGDSLLRQFSTELASHFGSKDMVARLGGDEFGVLLELQDETQTADELREWLRSAMATQFIVADTRIDVFCSIGVCVVDPNSDEYETTNVLNRADRNLYTDKRIRKFSTDDGGSHAELLGVDLDGLIRGLECAIDQQEFEVVYQPKVNCRTGDVTGLEALLRWNSPIYHIGPAQFIPIAEEYGLIKDIGKWVIRASCEQLRTWAQNGQPLRPVSINISPVQLEDVNFAVMIELTLLEFGIDPNLIEFELTEGAFGRQLGSFLEQMERTASLGCRWAIDDFGVGYSSLSRLHRLPISKLKIDKSFLEQMPKDPAAKEISNSIISMARSLNLSIVAEGVENPGQLVGLNLTDKDELQGFHCYMPKSANQTTALLNSLEDVFCEPEAVST